MVYRFGRDPISDLARCRRKMPLDREVQRANNLIESARIIMPHDRAESEDYLQDAFMILLAARDRARTRSNSYYHEYFIDINQRVMTLGKQLVELGILKRDDLSLYVYQERIACRQMANEMNAEALRGGNEERLEEIKTKAEMWERRAQHLPQAYGMIPEEIASRTAKDILRLVKTTRPEDSLSANVPGRH